MIGLRKISCCGIAEVTGLNSQKQPKTVLMAVMKRRLPRTERRTNWDGERFTVEISGINGSYILFTATQSKTIGDRLKKYIEKNNLGEVTKLPERVNPNSGNKLKPFVWTIKPRNAKAWYLKNK